jgi:N-acetylneuraminic acid mutarotase
MTLKQSFLAALLCCITTFSFAQTWTKAADFPGTPSRNAVTFVIGSNAYMGLGVAKGGIAQKSFWKYDAAKNSWTKVADFPGAWRAGTLTFVIKGKAYVGLVHSHIMIVG